MTTPLRRAAAPTGSVREGADDAGLELRRITFTHPGTIEPSLAEVDLAVAYGEMLAVVGPSGSGKTSTLRVTAGLALPERGEVFVGGQNLTSCAPERRGMSRLFQRPLLFAHLNVLDNVGFADRVAGHSRRRSRARAADYLGLVHLSHLAGRRTRTLSGGQEQRVALARALAAEPRVLLLDEPFSSLDAGVRADMHELLGEVRAVLAPTTVIVTHDLDEAALADRVAVLVAGRVHQVDSVTELFRRPASREVARVLGGFVEVEGTSTSRGTTPRSGCSPGRRPVGPWPTTDPRPVRSPLSCGGSRCERRAPTTLPQCSSASSSPCASAVYATPWSWSPMPGRAPAARHGSRSNIRPARCRRPETASEPP
ncbi:hypothetical protein BA895_13065 [Humibacillus sp. DSM 29435]|uniref:ABC transporter ATP-binding protein n=1 Tax=Humibacillus sp. DSM 29435 TaxID=1869167 RepID=UPI000871E9D7|nr:ABC transporter ATP-binding protein [Humibacillus sp. DSM 29435]OFE18060.1 hypothetical protein BA895_13065 [Humibacillus sp. DSM 29435]